MSIKVHGRRAWYCMRLCQSLTSKVITHQLSMWMHLKASFAKSVLVMMVPMRVRSRLCPV